MWGLRIKLGSSASSVLTLTHWAISAAQPQLLQKSKLQVFVTPVESSLMQTFGTKELVCWYHCTRKRESDFGKSLKGSQEQAGQPEVWDVECYRWLRCELWKRTLCASLQRRWKSHEHTLKLYVRMMEDLTRWKQFLNSKAFRTQCGHYWLMVVRFSVTLKVKGKQTRNMLEIILGLEKDQRESN